ncbi:hypothetical protein DPMN_174632 [Dreissena polymorpha]|uniref:Neurotransmitter-gated ion-channel ligand-binding domain-containing protein n=2 Tax=Dreissena polymorpha TaxID=45954 RepID=A0A9D4E675_DREPO|nr:hypothetical protein DPMN_174385 [Dreissena polymorpha]KAH3773273.1 hypothetical protein DPMN_174632 [Dreissena polymorpha]
MRCLFSILNLFVFYDSFISAVQLQNLNDTITATNDNIDADQIIVNGSMDSEDASGSKIGKKCLSIGYNSNSLPDIYNKIMERYRKNLHPNFGSQETFNVTINSRLETLIQLDQVEERLSSVMSFTINWRDTRLDWMNDILCLVNQNVSAKLPRQAFFMELDKELIWRPSITIANPHSPRYMLSDNIGVDISFIFINKVVYRTNVLLSITN